MLRVRRSFVRLALQSCEGDGVVLDIRKPLSKCSRPLFPGQALDFWIILSFCVDTRSVNQRRAQEAKSTGAMGGLVLFS